MTIKNNGYSDLKFILKHMVADEKGETDESMEVDWSDWDTCDIQDGLAAISKDGAVTHVISMKEVFMVKMQ